MLRLFMDTWKRIETLHKMLSVSLSYVNFYALDSILKMSQKYIKANFHEKSNFRFIFVKSVKIKIAAWTKVHIKPDFILNKISAFL